MTSFKKLVTGLTIAAAMTAPLAAMPQGAPAQGAGCPGCGRGGGGPGHGPGARLDPSSITSVQGTVEKIDRIQGRRHGGVHLTLATGSQSLDVHLGPDFYVDQQPLKVAVGDRVEVKGFQSHWNGQAVIVAQEVRRGGETLVLRDAQGVPRWSGRAP